MSTIKFSDAFDQYYQLKQKYEKSKKQLIEKISKSNSKKEKYNYFNSNIKCINCKQIGGTIFNQTKNILTAKCNCKTPCNLNIELHRAIYNNINDEVINIENDLLKIKSDVIFTKLNYLFGLVSQTETESTFSKLKENLIKIKSIYETFLKKQENIINNQERKNNVDAFNIRLNEYINEFKTIVSKYVISYTEPEAYYENNNEVIINSIKLYLDNMVPLNDKILNSKYLENYTIKDDDDINYLIQNNYKYSNLFIKINSTEEKVIKFQK